MNPEEVDKMLKQTMLKVSYGPGERLEGAGAWVAAVHRWQLGARSQLPQQV
jgi:hypothetical protein